MQALGIVRAQGWARISQAAKSYDPFVRPDWRSVSTYAWLVDVYVCAIKPSGPPDWSATWNRLLLLSDLALSQSILSNRWQLYEFALLRVLCYPSWPMERREWYQISARLESVSHLVPHSNIRWIKNIVSSESALTPSGISPLASRLCDCFREKSWENLVAVIDLLVGKTYSVYDELLITLLVRAASGLKFDLIEQYYNTCFDRTTDASPPFAMAVWRRCQRDLKRLAKLPESELTLLLNINPKSLIGWQHLISWNAR